MGFQKTIGLIGGIVVLGIGGGLALTNPDQAAYEDYALETLTVYLQEEVCQDISSPLRDLLQSSCADLVQQNQGALQELIHRNTRGQNWVFFSLYHTTLAVPGMGVAGINLLPSYQVETLGIFNQFFIYRAEQK